MLIETIFYLLLLILCGFYFMHSDPTYLPMQDGSPYICPLTLQLPSLKSKPNLKENPKTKPTNQTINPPPPEEELEEQQQEEESGSGHCYVTG